MKHFLKIIAIGFGLGIFLVFIQLLFQIPKDIFWKWYVAVSIVIIVGALILGFIINQKFMKKMGKALLLLESGEAERYIEEVNRLSQEAKGNYLKNLCTINLSVGYYALRNYDKAIELLESISENKLYGVLKMVYHLDLCCCYFYTHQIDKAMTLYDNSKKEFDLYSKMKPYERHIMILNIFVALEAGKFDYASAMLTMASENCDSIRLQKEYQQLDEIIQTYKSTKSV